MIVFWILVALAMAIIELLTPMFGFIFVTGAALLAALAAALEMGVGVQVIAFSVVLILLLVLLRPHLVKKLSRSVGVPSRMERLVGLEGQVTHEIDPMRGAGRVHVGDEDWSARAATPIPAGTRVRVVGADGIVLLVAPLETGTGRLPSADRQDRSS